MSKTVLKKMTYQEWCKATGKPFGIAVITGVGASCHLELFSSPQDMPGWYCVEVQFPFADQLTEEENMEMFWRRVTVACEKVQKSITPPDHVTNL